MKKTLTSLLLFAPFALLAQSDECFIYGKVTTVDAKSFTGSLRWNSEEVFWLDFFNSIKTVNKYHSYVSEADLMENIQNWFSIKKEEKKITEDSEGAHREESHAKIEKDLSHVWLCTFGDLQAIRVTGNESCDLVLRDGSVVAVKGGSNDLGARIKVLDNDLGELTVHWDKIAKIEFQKTPEKLNAKFGEPLFGTVKTSSGDFTGYIQWDQEERLTTDKLDGKTEDGEISLPFDKITAITKKGVGSAVTLSSGREIFLSGTNDVNSENRGICVNLEDVGRITIPWEKFVSAEFTKSVSYSQPTYADFGKTSKIKGEVISVTGNVHKGIIAYDLDEEYEFEFIQGNENGLEFAIPARNIAKLQPVGARTRITLKNGTSLTLGETHDVADYNSGVLIFTRSQDQPVYLKWSQVKEINLQ